MEMILMRNARKKIIVTCNPCDTHLFKPNQRTLSISEIVRKSCEFIGVSVEQIQSKKRNLHLVDARRMLAGILYYDLAYRLTKVEIGRFMGNRDHTTIIHLLKTLKTICETEENYKQRYYDLHMHVYNHDKFFRY